MNLAVVVVAGTMTAVSEEADVVTMMTIEDLAIAAVKMTAKAVSAAAVAVDLGEDEAEV